MSFDPTRLQRIDPFLQRYVDDGRLAGWQVVVGQHGVVEHTSTYGVTDLEAGTPVADDTLWRIYSMTKPVVSVAAMVLWEQGLLDLNDPVSRFIPSFADTQVFVDGSNTKALLEPAKQPVRVAHLLSHTSGLTYGFMQHHPVDAMYRAAGFDFGFPHDHDLAQVCDAVAALPLKFQPGTAWGYGVSTSVLGRVIEVASGQSLEAFVKQSVLEPLGMKDTSWWVEPERTDRLATLYAAVDGQLFRYDDLGKSAYALPTALDGGGGLISTAGDYWRFTRMLQGGGQADGVRVLAPRTLAMMTANQLPGGKDLGELNSGGFAETVFDGIGFGLGFAVTMDPRPNRSPASVGEYYWGGLASTAFWVDPLTGVSAAFYTQLVPSSTYPIRNQLRQLVYAALLD